VWIADGYTVSAMYPYSSRPASATARPHPQASLTSSTAISGDNNYIRNSVKATIDAYDGTVKLYIWTERSHHPGVGQGVPEPVLGCRHDAGARRPACALPEDLFSVQTFVYEKYHVTDPGTFFAQGDAWAIPPDPNQPNVTTALAHGQEIQPYYVLMLLPATPSRAMSSSCR